MRILCLTRALYISLHQSTESRCFAFSGTTSMPELRRDVELASSASVQIVGEFTRAEFDKFLKKSGVWIVASPHITCHTTTE